MTAEEIEVRAMKRMDMPDGAEMPDMMLYYAMRGLYAEYRCGQIQRVDAKMAKNRLVELHRKQVLMLEIYQQHERIRKDLSHIQHGISRGGCEFCKSVDAALCGIFKEEHNGH